jgi:hypothetical protein
MFRKGNAFNDGIKMGENSSSSGMPKMDASPTELWIPA